MGKGALKYGGKSGILPKVRPIFKHNPIRPLNAREEEEQARIVQGYAEGIPEPKGVARIPEAKKVVTVDERITKTITTRAEYDQKKFSLIESPTEDEKWQHQLSEIRRAHLKEAYVEESNRLKRLDELKERQIVQRAEAKKNENVYEESEATKMTLPTIDLYLQGPIVRARTEEEKELVLAQRKANRLRQELMIREDKTRELLELYHTAQKFITTEKELDAAIKEAFEVNVGVFESKQMAVENKLTGVQNVYGMQTMNESMVLDHALGDVNGNPGLESIDTSISGELEKLRLEAQAIINKGRATVNSD